MRGVVAFVLLLCLVSFQSSNNFLQKELLKVPKGFPEVIHPKGNPFSTAKWKLGKRLFYEKAFSRDSSISCSSCHLPHLAFSDSLSLSLGVQKRVGARNAPSLTNVAYQPYLLMDGGVPSIEQQVLVPIQEHVEFDFNIDAIADRLLKDSSYRAMSLEAFGEYPSPKVISLAVACFQRSLLSGNSPYDRFVNGDSTALTSDQKLGMKLFFSDEVGCSNCHSGFNFTNYEFANNGLALQYTDSGRMRITHLELDRDKFKVPTLRNVGLTAPYMHNGSVKSLTDVVEHYSGNVKANKSLDNRIKNTELNVEQKQQLVAFLTALTDSSFVNNNLFQKDF